MAPLIYIVLHLQIMPVLKCISEKMSGHSSLMPGLSGHFVRPNRDSYHTHCSQLIFANKKTLDDLKTLCSRSMDLAYAHIPNVNTPLDHMMSCWYFYPARACMNRSYVIGAGVHLYACICFFMYVCMYICDPKKV